MNKLIAMVAVGAVVLSGVALGMSKESQSQLQMQAIDDAFVQGKIDERLHALLVKARLERQAQ